MKKEETGSSLFLAPTTVKKKKINKYHTAYKMSGKKQDANFTRVCITTRNMDWNYFARTSGVPFH